MRITAHLFEAFLKCPTKCYLRSVGETGTDNPYDTWIRAQNENYLTDGIKRLSEGVEPDEFFGGPARQENLERGKWRLAVNLKVHAQNLESSIHALERVFSERQGPPTEFIPIRFIFTNQLTRQNKVMLAFDALVLSEMTAREIGFGKIIHGGGHAILKVKTSVLAGEVRRLIRQITALISNNSPPDLILDHQCAECEFQSGCRKKAIEEDDLSLLSAMSAKERDRYRSKGIFTVNHFSYTFRPRRTPKRPKNPAKPHYLALQALAIRENTIYLHGNPQIPDSKFKVYLDIEGLPDSDFYYLIGILGRDPLIY